MNFIRFSDFSFSETALASSGGSAPRVPEFHAMLESATAITTAMTFHVVLNRLDAPLAGSSLMSMTP
jgi:hypothetical protein